MGDDHLEATLCPVGHVKLAAQVGCDACGWQEAYGHLASGLERLCTAWQKEAEELKERKTSRGEIAWAAVGVAGVIEGAVRRLRELHKPIVETAASTGSSDG